jgi:hypothetical protein
MNEEDDGASSHYIQQYLTYWPKLTNVFDSFSQYRYWLIRITSANKISSGHSERPMIVWWGHRLSSSDEVIRWGDESIADHFNLFQNPSRFAFFMKAFENIFLFSERPILIPAVPVFRTRFKRLANILELPLGDLRGGFSWTWIRNLMVYVSYRIVFLIILVSKVEFCALFLISHLIDVVFRRVTFHLINTGESRLEMATWLPVFSIVYTSREFRWSMARWQLSEWGTGIELDLGSLTHYRLSADQRNPARPIPCPRSHECGKSVEIHMKSTAKYSVCIITCHQMKEM